MLFKSEHFYAATLILAVCGIILGAYWNILSTEDATKATLAGYQARLDMVEASMRQTHDENEHFASEMRATLSQIGNNVADLRVLEAARTKK